MKPKILLLLLFTGVVILSYAFHRMEIKITNFRSLMRQIETDQVSRDIAADARSRICLTNEVTTKQTKMEVPKKDKEVKYIVAKLDQRMPKVTFTDVKTTTSAKSSKATLVSLKGSYCVGEHLLVRLDLFDHLGKRKEYGGDFLRARIYSPGLKAAASGHIQDYKNGTYLVNFTLFWEGDVKVSLLLIHSSEAVSALWAARKKGYDKVIFRGKYLNGASAVFTKCTFNITTEAELCEYLDDRDQEAFYCVKPKNVSCAAFLSLMSYNAPMSYLTDLERSLIKRTNIGVEIPPAFKDIHVVPCESNKTTAREPCRFKVTSPFPSGFALQNQWHLVSCTLENLNTLDHLYTCLQGKVIYLLGDSTSRQWIEYLTRTMKSLKYLDTHGFGRHPNLVAVDMNRKIQVQWKKHNHPLVTASEYLTTDHNYIAREIDSIAGDKDTAVVVALGQHFRPFPIELFVHRALNVRRAIQRLLQRSPHTRVVIKGENTRELDVDQERFSDFHGFAQYLAAKDVFGELDVAFVDAWDMTIAYATGDVHPPDHVIGNQINMFLNYIC